MRPFLKITQNAFMELVRQPIFLILLCSSCVFIVFLAVNYYFTMGESTELVKDSALAVIFLVGLFGAVTSASASVSNELRSGTALAVLAKPVGRAQFLIAKYLGVAGALTLLAFANLVAALLSSRISFDVYGDPDLLAVSIYMGAILFAFVIGGLTNYFLSRPFVSDAVFLMVGATLLAFIAVNSFLAPVYQGFKESAGTADWRLVPAVILILFAVWLLAGIAVACSTRFEIIPTLAICSAFFLIGLMSDYLFGTAAAEGNMFASILYTVTPNWQLFWLADALEGQKTIPWSYVIKAFGYLATYLGALLAIGLLLFEDRELS